MISIEKLKEKKKELALTNQQLANISGVSLGTINKIFSGATKSPQLSTLKALIRALDLDSESDYQPDILREPSFSYQVQKNTGTYTSKDYDNLPDDVRAELIDGHLIFMESPTIQHQEILGELFFSIRSYIKHRSGLCKILLSPIDVYLDEDDKTILQPDLVILCDPGKNNGKQIKGAPDFVAEVVSPSSRRRDYLTKLNKYWTAGVREYWIIDPEQTKVSVYCFSTTDENFSVKTYSFQDKIPIGIYGDLIIDFSEFEL